MNTTTIVVMAAIAAGAYGIWYATRAPDPSLAEQVVDAAGAPFRLASMLPWLIVGVVVFAVFALMRDPALLRATVAR